MIGRYPQIGGAAGAMVPYGQPAGIGVMYGGGLGGGGGMFGQPHPAPFGGGMYSHQQLGDVYGGGMAGGGEMYGQPPQMFGGRAGVGMYAQQQLQIPQVQSHLPFLEQQQQDDTSTGNIIADE
jgi:hypothetical protein